MPGHAIISGGSSGIGLALAGQLAARGWRLSLLARNKSLLDEAVAGLGDRSQGIACDVADATQVERAFEEACIHSGAPDLVLLSAGICEPGHFLEQPLAVHERSMQVNYMGSLYCARAAASRMQSGRIVLISSGAGLVGVFGYSTYSPGKFALRGLAEVLKAELQPRGIGVSIVYPPDTETPQLAKERLTRPAETTAITESAGIRAADEVASRILAALQKQRFSIPIGMELTLLSWLGGLIGPLLRWHFGRLTARAGRSRQ